MPFNLGGPELIIVLVIVLIVFGAGKLPKVMRDVGQGVKEFRSAQKDEQQAAADAASASTTAAPSTTVAPVAPSTNGAARTSEPAPRA